MNMPEKTVTKTTMPTEFNYHLLRNALNDFGKSISSLSDAEYQQVERKASKSYELESLVITAPEAEGVIISDTQLDQAVAEVASRYENSLDFKIDLQNNGLAEASLRNALYRELLFDSVIQRVGANGPDVNDIDVRLFYEMHRDRFETPEKRVVRHILITINPDYPENTPTEALARMKELAEKLGGRSNRFQQFAKRHSECPTAMDGGNLGEVQRGQLYSELDNILFTLQENEISPIIESQMGFHLLLCEKIKPAKSIPLSKVASRIRETLQERHRRNCQKHWISNLKKTNHNQVEMHGKE